MAENYEGVVNHSEEPNLFGAMSSIGFQMYGYVLAQNAGRAASNYKRMYDAHNPVEPKTKSSYSGHRSEYASPDKEYYEKKASKYEKKLSKVSDKISKSEKKITEHLTHSDFKGAEKEIASSEKNLKRAEKYRKSANFYEGKSKDITLNAYEKSNTNARKQIFSSVSSDAQKLDDVFLHVNVPFTGRLDKGGLGSINKAYNGLKASDDTIVSAFKSNNHHFFSQLENSGFSKDDVKKLKKFASLSNKDSYFKTYSGASEYVKDSDNIVENILNTKKKYSSSKSTPAGKPNTAPKTSVVNPKEVFSNETTPSPSIVEEKSPVVSSPQFEKISTEKPVKKGVVSSMSLS